jgi:hypothetical protein
MKRKLQFLEDSQEEPNSFAKTEKVLFVVDKLTYRVGQWF